MFTEFVATLAFYICTVLLAWDACRWVALHCTRQGKADLRALDALGLRIQFLTLPRCATLTVWFACGAYIYG